MNPALIQPLVDVRHAQIVELEAEIEALAEQAERCRKTIIVARIAMLAGIGTLVILILGGGQSRPMLLVAGLALLIGGLGGYGSSQGTLAALSGEIAGKETTRRKLIDTMALEPVSGYP